MAPAKRILRCGPLNPSESSTAIWACRRCGNSFAPKTWSFWGRKRSRTPAAHRIHGPPTQRHSPPCSPARSVPEGGLAPVGRLDAHQPPAAPALVHAGRAPVRTSDHVTERTEARGMSRWKPPAVVFARRRGRTAHPGHLAVPTGETAALPWTYDRMEQPAARAAAARHSVGLGARLPV